MVGLFQYSQPVTAGCEPDMPVRISFQKFEIFFCLALIPAEGTDVSIHLPERIQHVNAVIGLKISHELLDILHHHRWGDGFQAAVLVLAIPDVRGPLPDKGFLMAEICLLYTSRCV